MIDIFMELFSEYSKEESAVRDTLRRVPIRHKNLFKGYNFKFEKSNTLDGDHVGEISVKGDKKVRISAPWNYGREFVLLHELAHLVWKEYIQNKELEEKWRSILKKHPFKQEKAAEEAFAHCYANFYSRNKIVGFDNKEREKFIEELK